MGFLVTNKCYLSLYIVSIWSVASYIHETYILKIQDQNQLAFPGLLTKVQRCKTQMWVRFDTWKFYYSHKNSLSRDVEQCRKSFPGNHHILWYLITFSIFLMWFIDFLPQSKSHLKCKKVIWSRSTIFITYFLTKNKYIYSSFTLKMSPVKFLNSL